MNKILSLCCISLLFNASWIALEIIQTKSKAAVGQSIGGLSFETLAEPKLNVISQGSKPFHNFHSSPKAKTKQIVSINLSQDLSMSDSKSVKKQERIKKTETTIVLENEVIDIERDQNTRCKFKYLQIKSLNYSDEQNMPNINQDLYRLVGSVGTFLISPKGKVKESSFQPSIKNSYLDELLMKSLAKSYENAYFIFPEESIGVGALWNNIIVIKIENAYAFFVSWYKVISFKDNALNLEVKSQMIPRYGFDTFLGKETKLDSFSFRGYGKMIINLGQVMPILVDQEVKGKLVARSAMKDVQGEIKMESLGRIKVISSLKVAQ